MIESITFDPVSVIGSKTTGFYRYKSCTNVARTSSSLVSPNWPNSSPIVHHDDD